MISERKNKIYTTEQFEISKGTSSHSITLPESIAVTGDVRIDFYSSKLKRKVSKN